MPIEGVPSSIVRSVSMPHDSPLVAVTSPLAAEIRRIGNDPLALGDLLRPHLPEVNALLTRAQENLPGGSRLEDNGLHSGSHLAGNRLQVYKIAANFIGVETAQFAAVCGPSLSSSAPALQGDEMTRYPPPLYGESGGRMGDQLLESPPAYTPLPQKGEETFDIGAPEVDSEMPQQVRHVDGEITRL